VRDSGGGTTNRFEREIEWTLAVILRGVETSPGRSLRR